MPSDVEVTILREEVNRLRETLTLIRNTTAGDLMGLIRYGAHRLAGMTLAVHDAAAEALRSPRG